MAEKINTLVLTASLNKEFKTKRKHSDLSGHNTVIYLYVVIQRFGKPYYNHLRGGRFRQYVPPIHSVTRWSDHRRGLD
jgi:hypothetical protein